MGRLQQVCTGRSLELESETSIGRSPKSVVALPVPHVSASHASIRWLGDHWSLRDLGSRNGTWLDGQRVVDAEGRRLIVSSRLSFGAPEDVWVVVDVSPPAALLQPLAGGAALHASDLPLALPTEGDALATVFADAAGLLVLETESDRRYLRDQEVFEVAGASYKTVIPERTLQSTQPATSGASMREVELSFQVSRDEEHVRVEVRLGSGSHLLSARAHNYFLLLLARERLEQRACGVGLDSEGWLAQDELCSRLRVDRQRLNTDIFRVRKQFSALGLTDPANVIERRHDSRELRLGTGRVQVHTLA